MVGYTLGLDLGSNSVGWAMIARDDGRFDNGLPLRTGVRIFPEGVDQLDTKKEKPRGQDRRLARGQRRMHQRRTQRRRKLLALLRSAGLAPTDAKELPAWTALGPYPLRAKALDARLEPGEFGRLLYHLCQRRGFKSNRKTGKSKEDGKVAKETGELRRRIQEGEARTLGEYLSRLDAGFSHKAADGERVRNRYTLRSMYEEEFEKLWTAQSSHYPGVLTNELKAKVKDAIFFQRPLWFDPGRIGECELEPGEKRCPRAHWMGQQFRMLQEINLLKVIDPSGEERPLTAQERSALAGSLAPKKEMTFDQIRQLLGFQASQTFNLEDLAKRKALKGNPVEAALCKKPLDKWYAALPPEKRERLYLALAEEEDESTLRALATGEWGLSDTQAEKLLGITLPPGHFRVSLKAIRKLMPLLVAGRIFSEAKELAGYSLVVPALAEDSLPPVDAAVKNLTNPLVHRALGEARKVVNALIREYGKPAEIVVELARDMKHSRDKRRELFFENLNRRDENEAVRQRIQTEFNLPSPSRDDVIKYKLWEESNHECPYCGRIIPKNELFSGAIQVEHILPYSRTLEDGYLNKTLIHEDENRRKHNRTPFECYSADQAAYDAILQRTARLPYPKRRKFMQKEVDLDACVERQLNDTRYVSRVGVGYLRALGCPVRCVKGGTTAELRHQWGLDEVLGLKGLKNRGDHRHHAVDAVVIALTSRAALQKLSTVRYNPERPRFDVPWDGFRNDVGTAVSAINVSHRPARRLAGALHQDTAYGPTPDPTRFVYRKPVESLTEGEIAEIRDPTIRRIVAEAAAQRGLKKALTNPPLCMPSGVPIRRVRIQTVQKTAIPIRADRNGRPDKYVLPGGNHHVEIYELPDGTWTGRAVTRFDAHRRLRAGKAVIQRNPQDDPALAGAKFVMSLCINDMVLLTELETRKSILCRVQKTSVGPRGTIPDISFRHHTAATLDDKDALERVRSWTALKNLELQKVVVDPLGRTHPCHD